MKMGKKKIREQMTEAEENFLIDFQFLIQDLIVEKGISRSELAKRAGVSKARLSQILSAEANPTVKTFARLFEALGTKVVLEPAHEHEEVGLASKLESQETWQVQQDLKPNYVRSHGRKMISVWSGVSNDNYVVTAPSHANSFRLRAA